MTEKKSALDALNGRQRDFVLRYAKSGIMKQAALEAGYSRGGITAIIYNLSKNPKVQAAIHELRADDEDATIASIKELREWWTSIIRGTGKAGEGAELKEQLKASDLLGKSQGAFLDRLDLTNSDGSLAPTIDVSKLSTEVLRELMRAQRAAE